MTRELPHSPDAERSVIGTVLTYAYRVAGEVSELRADDMFLPAHRSIWETVRERMGTGAAVDPVAVADAMAAAGTLSRLEGGAQYLMDCVANDSVAEQALAPRVLMVRKKAALRRLIALCSNVAAQAYGGQDIDALLGEARKGVAELEDYGGAEAGPVRVGDVMPRVLATVEERATERAQPAVLTGLRAYDTKIGGLLPDSLIVVAGPPGMGKTAWMGTVAAFNAIVRGVPGLIFSLEMSRQEQIQRFLAREGQVSTRDMVTGTIARDKAQWSRVLTAATAYESAPLWLDDRADMSTSQILGTARRWHARHVAQAGHQLGWIGIDYLGLVRAEAGEKTREREVAAMTRAFKMLAKALHCPVVLLSQLSRAHAKESRKPILADLRDSGAIEADADVVIFPWREFKTDEQGRALTAESGPAEWIVAKNRHGPTGSIDAHWHGPTTSFFDAVEERRVADTRPHWGNERDDD